jgi:hypothetical protein
MFHPVRLHWRCYLAWPGRAAFALQLFRRLVSEAGESWGRAHVDDHLAVLLHVARPHALQLVLAETGRRLFVGLDEWERWRADPGLVAPSCHQIERLALRRALAPIWEQFPNSATLVARTDWTGSERHLYA